MGWSANLMERSQGRAWSQQRPAPCWSSVVSKTWLLWIQARGSVQERNSPGANTTLVEPHSTPGNCLLTSRSNSDPQVRSGVSIPDQMLRRRRVL